MIDIEALLPLVEKPSRYIDHEINAARKSFDALPVRMLFAFPDLYELGVSHLGLKILYSIVNELDYAMADRMYLPWLDLLKLLEEHNLPLFGLESRRSAQSFDLIGITLQSELNFTNVLKLIEASQIPLRSTQRQEAHPLIMAGGPCASNPLPLAPFIDVFFIGEAEEAIEEIAVILRNYPSRSERLRELKKVAGCWIPEYHDGELLLPAQPIKSRKYASFHHSERLHKPQLLSWQLATHNRYTAEIMRGCSRGCRFCHAGYFYRPVRERDSDDIIRELTEEIQTSGWDDAGLISLSSSDYSCIRELMWRLMKVVDTGKTHISLPSLRVDSLDDSLVSLMKELGREGLTIAPEAGSQRLRDIINKNLNEAEILRGVEIAQSLSWQKIKLYFMIGLPEETDADIQAIIDLIHKINLQGKKRLQLNVTISPFTPKPFTPFQWSGMLERDLLLKRALTIKDAFARKRNIRIRYHQIENSILEACLTRGDLRMAEVLYTAYRQGALFDGWQESWEYSRWENAFAAQGINPKEYLSAFDPESPLPWDFIDIGVCKKFLKSEWAKAQKAESTPDCRELCSLCGACNEEVATVDAPKPLALESYETPPKPEYNIQIQYRYRIGYEKLGLLRFISHLDWMRMLFRRISILELPTVFTMGFSPHPKVSLSPPLPLGVESHAEYFDISFYKELKPEEILSAFAQTQIPDFKLSSCQRIGKDAWLPHAELLQIVFPIELYSQIDSELKAFAASERRDFIKKTEKREKSYDLKEIILDYQLSPTQLLLKKSLASPALYDVLEATFRLPKETLYQMQICRKAFY